MKCTNKQLSNILIMRDELICKGDWNQNNKCLQLLSSKGISPSKIIAENSNFYLSPEDALFFMHKGELAAYFEGVVMSLQECYILMNQSETGIKHSILYNFFSDFGYKICRYEPSLPVENLTNTNIQQEKELNYFKVNHNDVELNIKSLDCILWKGKTKPLTQCCGNFTAPSLLLSCRVNQQLSDIKELGSLEESVTPDFDIYPHQKHYKSALKKSESHIEVFVADRDHHSLMKNIFYLSHKSKASAIVAVDAEAEIKLFSFSTTSVEPTLPPSGKVF